MDQKNTGGQVQVSSGTGTICFRVILSLLVFLLIIAVSAGSYFGYAEIEKLKVQNQTLTESYATIERAKDTIMSASQDIHTYKNINSQLQNDNFALRSQNEEIRGTIESTQDLVTTVNQRLDRYEKRNPNDWFITNAFFLLSQAHQNVIYEQQIETAIYKMKFADKLLEHIVDPKILELRKSIAKDLTALENQPKIDFTGLAFSLDNVYANVEKLTLTGREVTQEAPAQPADTTQGSWTDNLLNSARDFSQRFIEIRRKSPNSIDEFITPALGSMLKETVKVRINLAKSNVMYHDEASYKTNLQQAYEYLDKYFDHNDPTLEATLTKIKELLDTKIKYELETGLESYSHIDELFKEEMKKFEAIEENAEEAEEEPAQQQGSGNRNRGARR